MSLKNAKGNLDDEFEAFLKESLSLEGSFDPPDSASEKTTPWWDGDEESSDGTVAVGSSGKHFLKKKKPAIPNHASLEITEKPALTPEIPEEESRSAEIRHRVLERLRAESPEDKLPDKPKLRSKKEITSSKGRSGRSKTEVSISKDSLEDISEKSEEESNSRNARSQAVDSSLDSTQNPDHSKVASEILESPAKHGMETLEELADKERFFQNLEKNSEDTIDYGRLNQNLSQTGGMHGAAASPADQRTLAQGSEDCRGGRDPTEIKPSLLSKVALMDSLESTLNTTTSPKARDLRDTGQNFQEMGPQDTLTGFIGTNTSKDIEQAYQQALQDGSLSAMFRDEEGTKRERTVEDILKEMEKVQREARHVDAEEFDVSLMSDLRSPRARGLSRQQEVEEDQPPEEQRGFDLSPVAKGDGHFPYSPAEDADIYEPVTAVSLKEKTSKKKLKKKKDVDESGGAVHESGGEVHRSTSLEKKKKTKRDKSSDKYKQKKLKRDKSEDKMKGKTSARKLSPKRSVSATRLDESLVTPEKRSCEKFEHVQSSGYGQKCEADPTWSPGNPVRLKNKASGIPRPQREQKPPATPLEAHLMPPATPLEAHLMASVESFANYIKDQLATVDGKKGQKSDNVVDSASWHGNKIYNGEREPPQFAEIKEWQEQWRGQCTLVAKLKANMEAQEREGKRQLESQKLRLEQEIFRLKQDNFILGARVSETEKEHKMKARDAGSTDGGDHQVALLEKEVREQEGLIAGYEQENKRLYEEMKKREVQTRATEERMFQENQKLRTEVMNLRSLLDEKELQVRHHGIITSTSVQQEIAAGNMGPAALGAGRIAHLEAELRKMQNKEETRQREQKMHEQTKVELERHIDQLLQEKDKLKERLEGASSGRTEGEKALEEKYEKEVERLNRKLKWYAENQTLLDKDASRLREKDDEIHALKLRIEELQTETGRRVEESKIRAKERAADGKKIMDLERQVKEMDSVIRKRNPNSIPALMMAAAAAPDNGPRNRSMQVLESRIKKLEAELEGKDQDMERSLRSMEQKYNAMKLQYESRIQDLEDQLRPGDLAMKNYDHPHTHTSALQRELDSMRGRYRTQISELQSQVEATTMELGRLRRKDDVVRRSEDKLHQERSVDTHRQVSALQMALESKSQEVLVLQKTLERVKDSQPLVNGFTHHHGMAVGNKSSKILKGRSKKADDGGLPPYSNSVHPEREYVPDTFSGVHVSDVIHENEALKMKVEQLQWNLDQQRVEHRKSLAETEAVVRQSREDFEDKITELRSSHQRELLQVQADKAMNQSSSRVWELQNSISSQEVVVKHLREQLACAQVDNEKLSVLKIREMALENQLQQIRDELREAKRNHTPEMRHFESLLEKITHMEQRHEKREQELQQVIRSSHRVASLELEQETAKWKKILDAKHEEIASFRSELDSILEVIQLLQKQGVIIPVS